MDPETTLGNPAACQVSYDRCLTNPKVKTYLQSSSTALLTCSNRHSWLLITFFYLWDLWSSSKVLTRDLISNAVSGSSRDLMHQNLKINEILKRSECRTMFKKQCKKAQPLAKRVFPDYSWLHPNPQKSLINHNKVLQKQRLDLISSPSHYFMAQELLQESHGQFALLHGECGLGCSGSNSSSNIGSIFQVDSHSQDPGSSSNGY